MNSLLKFAQAAFVCLLLPACVPPAEAPGNALHEAYTLMDRGENAKAVLLMERTLREDPANPEASLLLASAYMGSAGVDIYSLHDAFKDILFADPLENSFLGGGARPALDQPEALPPPPAPTPTQGPAQALFAQLDDLLNRSRKVALFLNRFPHVDEVKWPYLIRALEVLDPLQDSGKDVKLYRVFIRVVLLKAYIEVRILRDSQLGTRPWVCRQDLSGLEEGLTWITGHLVKASSDFNQVFPDRASSLNRIHSYLAASLDELTLAREQSPPGTGLSLLQAEQGLGRLLQCPAGESRAPSEDLVSP